MDVLADVMQSVRLQSHVYGRMEMTAPWGLRFAFEGGRHPAFYLVSRGTCWLAVDGKADPIPMVGGDFVLLPGGGPSTLKDRLETPAVAIQDLVAENRSRSCVADPTPVLRYGGGGAAVSLICGCFSFESGAATPLIDLLPQIIHVRGDEGEPVPWLASTLRFLASESASAQPGSEIIRGRLADILFVQAIRAHVAQEGDRAIGWLRALSDPQIGRTLRLIHDRPGDPWTVDLLADGVAMSRSSFADRFRSLVGVPPLGYLTRWRMHVAAQMLREGDSKVATVAAAVGYETEGSFGKVFKRITGRSPGEFRVDATRRTAV